MIAICDRPSRIPVRVRCSPAAGRQGDGRSFAFGAAGTAAIVAAVLAVALLPGCKRKADIAQPLKEVSGVQASQGSQDTRLKPHAPADGEESFIDPFCGLKLRKSESAGSFDYKGVTYYFCTEDHLKAFKEDPEKYLNIDTDDGN